MEWLAERVIQSLELQERYKGHQQYSGLKLER